MKKRVESMEICTDFIGFVKAFNKFDGLKVWKILEERGFKYYLVKVVRRIHIKYKNNLNLWIYIKREVHRY
jgi:hypothetical protein